MVGLRFTGKMINPIELNQQLLNPQELDSLVIRANRRTEVIQRDKAERIATGSDAGSGWKFVVTERVNAERVAIRSSAC